MDIKGHDLPYISTSHIEETPTLPEKFITFNIKVFFNQGDLQYGR
jgi:hypothetical protein